MKKLIFLLFSVTLVVGLASCTDDDNLQEPEVVNTIDPTDETEPTDDQMSVKVTADLSAYVPSAFDEGSTGAALVARLPLVTSDIQPDTRIVLLKGSDFEVENTLPDDMMKEITRIYMNGGYVGLERPTRKQAANLSLELVNNITEIMQADLQRNFSINAAAAAAAARQSRTVERLRVRMENMERLGNALNGETTRGDGGKTDEIQSEMLILGITEYFLQQPYGANSEFTFRSEDSEGNVTDEQTTAVTVNRTPYASGQLADAAALWLNDVLKPQSQKPSAAPRRAASNAAINDIMGASESFTYSGHVPTRNSSGDTRYYRDRVNMTVRCWSVHDLNAKKDYYYLTQGVRISLNKETWRGADSNSDWRSTTAYGDYDVWIGSFLSGYETSMNLRGDGGNIIVEAALPTTENKSTTMSVETGSMSSTTHTLGGSLGFSGGNQGASFNLSGNASWGFTEGTSFALESTFYSNEWGVTKNTDHNKVTWTYKGTLPALRKNSNKYVYDQPADILINDCNMNNEICWSVANPTRQYTVDISSMTQTGALLSSTKLGKSSNRPQKYEYTSERTDYSHTLLQPSRATQTWRMDVKIEEWKNESVQDAKNRLLAAIQGAFPDVYASVFKVADKSLESMDMINYLVTYTKEKFDTNYEKMQEYAQELGIKKYSISWKCDEWNIHKVTPYVVDVTATPPALPIPPGLHAYALWCEGNNTLYFVAVSDIIKKRDMWDGQTVTNLWADDEVLSTSSDGPTWIDDVQGQITRVVFDKSFAYARPTNCAQWFCMLPTIETFEGLENLNTSKVTSTAWMFHYCENVQTLDVSGFDMSNVTDARNMFRLCTSLRTIYCSQSWNISNSLDMFYGCMHLSGAIAYNREYDSDCSMANPVTGYFTWPEGTNLVTLNDNGSNSALLKRYEGQTVFTNYNRTLTATIDDNGNYVPTPYTVCLPYDLDLSQAVNAGNAEIYTLAAVSSGEFVFAKLNITTLVAGEPYLVRMLKGSIPLKAQQPVIKAVRPKSTKVYSSLAQWRRGEGTEIGIWVGNFDYMSAADAADDNAFALQPSDRRWDYYKADNYAWIPAFRAYLSSSSIEKKAYKSRFTE